MAGEWAVYRTKPFGKTYGYCLPMFIHNIAYHLTDLGVYSDGLFDCWNNDDHSAFIQDVANDWAATFPAAGATFSVTLLGHGTVTEADWSSSPDAFVKQAEALLHTLNPSGQNLVTIGSDGLLRRGQVRWSSPLLTSLCWVPNFLKSKKPAKTSWPVVDLANEVAYYVARDGNEIAGNPLSLFAMRNGEPHLTQWFVFADGMSCIGGEGKILTQAEVDEQWATGKLSTNAPQGAWINLDGLGRFRSDDAKWYIKAEERQKEARDEIAMLNGAPGTQSVCMAALENYEASPSDANKEALRTAYEAVPEHLRMFCGDMDDKDGPIQNILYGDAGDAGRDEDDESQ